jgi:hypothetical protein
MEQYTMTPRNFEAPFFLTNAVARLLVAQRPPPAGLRDRGPAPPAATPSSASAMALKEDSSPIPRAAVWICGRAVAVVVEEKTARFGPTRAIEMLQKAFTPEHVDPPAMGMRRQAQGSGRMSWGPLLPHGPACLQTTGGDS